MPGMCASESGTQQKATQSALMGRELKGGDQAPCGTAAHVQPVLDVLAMASHVCSKQRYVNATHSGMLHVKAQRMSTRKTTSAVAGTLLQSR